jgi:hypothetical protein
MSKEQAIQEAFRQLVTRKEVTFSAMVISVDKEKGICTVLDDKLEYKVRLAAVINDSKEKFFLYPKINSVVLVAPIEEDVHQLHVIKYSAVEQLRLRIGATDFCIDKDGFNFKKENESLRSCMLELIAAIKALKFTTNMGPTIKLINIQDFTAVETKFKNLLKDI